MSASGLAIQKAVFTALTTPAIVDVGARVYDLVPQNAEYPHIELGGGSASDWSAADLSGEEHTVEVHVWTRARGYAQARRIMADVKTALHEQSLSMTSITTDVPFENDSWWTGEADALIDIRFVDSQLFLDADGLTQHGVLTFSAIINRQ